MTEPAYELLDADRFAALPESERNALCWRAGTLEHLLDPLQRTWYAHYRSWSEQDLYSGDTKFIAGSFPRLFGMEGSKRVGKATFSVLGRLEDCIRNPCRKYRPATASERRCSRCRSCSRPASEPPAGSPAP